MGKQKNDLEKQADIYLGSMPKMTVMQPTVVNVDGPSENVASKENEDLLCRSDNRDNYHDCDDYNTIFCREKCEFGPKEIATPDLDCGIYDSEQSTILPKLK